LADAVPHCIVKLGPSGNIEYYNQRWLEYTGSKTKIDWQLLVHPKDARRSLALWLRMQHRSIQSHEMELRLRNVKDGIYRWHLIRVIPEVKEGESASWIVSCTDIDTIKNTEESFKVLSQELNRSNKELEEYAYVASHDLKEPLHVVSSFVHLLEKKFQSKLENEEKDYLKYIKEGVGQAQRLIKDLLEYSRIGREKTAALVDISLILTEIFANINALVEESGAEIICGTMPKVMASYVEMVQLFQNLIINAIKYRSTRPLKIRITARPEGKMWLFAVQDNGIGIESQYQERIFDMFQRLHPKNEYSGTGIGLAICKKIVEKHGGKIWIDSIPQEGSTFYFTIKQNT
jgi:light-regulated signal transduction histidine kinase (bacteriophytochrome)